MVISSIIEVNGGFGSATNGHSNRSNSEKQFANGQIDNFRNGHGPLHMENHEPPEPVAIVGMALRLPGGIHSPEELWRLLVNKETTRCPVPAGRYNIDGFYSATKQAGSVNLRHGHYLADHDSLDNFDTSFFTMSKAEVEALDPQQRMLLEVVFECMENAGQKDWRGTNIGLFVGTWGDDWLDLKAKDIQRAGVFNITGTGDFALSNRVSYEYDLQGPSITIKAACASSMIGLHEACEALLRGECSSAVVAGANLIIAPTMTIAQSEAGVLSPTGECRTFDASANGYARGEAINAILIKKLSDAIRDNDPIRAVIRATSSNSDGRSNGMTNPRPEGHERLIRRTYEKAHIDEFVDTPFVECHGTGTQTGDPLELEAIGKLFGSERGVYVGSIKPNVGHSEGASGISSVIKAVMSLENKTIPPNINFQTPNPRIPFEEHNMRVPLNSVPWPKDRLERISVNCFGIGGSNAHAIIDSAESFGITTKRSLVNGHVANGRAATRPKLLIFSARHNDSLRKSVADIQEYIVKHPERLGDVAYTLCMRRDHLTHRAFGLTDGTSSLEINMADKAKTTPQMNFVFTGQGAQWPAMGKDLMEDFPAFRSSIRTLANALRRLPCAPPWDLEEELLKSGPNNNIQDAIYAQPLLTAIQVALVDFLRSIGVFPAAVIGHSSGEIAAAYAANALTAEEAITAAYYRGLATRSCKQRGAMAAVGLGKAEVSLYLERGVVVACENSPVSVTLSGDEAQVDAVIEKLRYDDPNLFARRLKTGGMAYHSHHMAEVGEIYEDLMKPYVIGQAPTIPFYSSVSGKLLKTAELGSSYWRQNLEFPVKFDSAVRACLKDQTGDQLLLEIGPHSALAGPLRQIFKAMAYRNELIYSPTLMRGKNSTMSMLESVGKLYLNAVPIDFEHLTAKGQTLTDLPSYPWRHETSYWSESRITKEWRFRKFPHHEILGSRILEGNDLEPTWRNLLRLTDVTWIQDHKVLDDIVFPGAAYIAMIGEAIRQISGVDDYSLRNITMKTGLVLHDSHDAELITTLKPVRLTATLDSTWYDFSISSYNGNIWTKHCTGQARPGQDVQYDLLDPSCEIKSLPRKVSLPYSALRKVGLNYGERFQGLNDLSAMPGKKTVAATLAVPIESESVYGLHPTTIDHCLQLFIFAPCEGVVRNLTKLVVPTQIDHIYIRSQISKGKLRATAAATSSASTGVIRGEVIIMQDDQVLLSLTGGKFSPLEEDSGGIKDSDTIAATRLHWRPDMDFLKVEELMPVRVKDPKAIEEVEAYGLLCTVTIQHQIKQLQGNFCAEHMTKFSNWLDNHVEEARKGENNLVTNAQDLVNLAPAERQSLIVKMRAELETHEFAPAAELISRLLDNCVDCFSGRTEALEIYLENGGLTNVYNLTADRVDAAPFFAAAGHVNPTMKVLEIGAGTGGTTLVALQALTSTHNERMYSSYTYTDISSGFFGTAKERFREYQGIEYKVLDVSKNPSEQGFESGTFDLIIASNVVHATPVLQRTLRHVRKLLAPRGRFFLQELAPSTSNFNNLIMGILPGWWLGEADGRSMAPSASVERWNTELQAAGFAPIEGVVYDDPDLDKHIGMNIVARPANSDESFRVVTLLHLESQEDCPFVRQIEDVLLADGFIVDRCTFGDLIPQQQDVISVLELETPIIHGLTPKALEDLKEMLADIGSSSILWVTRSSQVDCEDPRFSQSLGLARTIRSELSIPFATLELDALTSTAFGAVLKVFNKLRDTAEDVQPEFEYVLKANVVNIGRYHWTSVEKELSLISGTEHRPLKVDVGRPGLLHSLRWVPYTLESLGANEVVVAPRCVGVNFRDILVAMGLVDSGSVGLGLEGSGVIAAVGSNVKHLQPGDRVMGMGQNYFSTQTVALADHVVSIPDTLSFQEAATMPCVYVTVIHALLEVANLQKNQTILIHSACGGVGIAAIHICQMVGAKIFCTVGNDDKVNYLMKEFGIARHHIFHSRNASFLPDLMRETSHRGVDIVLNSLSGELLHTSWKCVAVRGKMLEIGKRDFIGRAQLDMDLFEANRSFIGIDLATLPDHYHELLEKVVGLFNQGHIKPIAPTTEFDATKVEDAFRYMQQGAHIGKIVVKIPQDQHELPVAPVGQNLQLRGDVAYLLVGGLGGLGVPVSTWFVECGARHIIYLSRSAGTKDEDRAFFRELEIQGCTIQAISGDVSNLEDVRAAVNSAKLPIAGVVQMAMVLQDDKIPNMSHETWRMSVAPKVEGTWNLHKALDGINLDFFVLFSSISGCFGFAHQANYASGNSFQDAFVQYRHKLGLPASVLDVGAMDDIGYISLNKVVQDSLKTGGTWFLSETDLLNALHLSILQSAPGQATESRSDGFVETSQLTIGIRATKPMSEPSNRVAWKRDKRADILRNLESNSIAATDTSASDTLASYLREIELSPSLLETSESLEVITKEIGVCIYGFMLQPLEEVDVKRSLNALGVDSLVTIEVKNWLRRRMAIEVSTLEILNGGTIESLGVIAVERLRERLVEKEGTRN